jgi:hypothetical protein
MLHLLGNAMLLCEAMPCYAMARFRVEYEHHRITCHHITPHHIPSHRITSRCIASRPIPSQGDLPEGACDFRVANALDMPFDDESFDFVWSLESGEHMPDKVRVRVCVCAYVRG